MVNERMERSNERVEQDIQGFVKIVGGVRETPGQNPVIQIGQLKEGKQY